MSQRVVTTDRALKLGKAAKKYNNSWWRCDRCRLASLYNDLGIPVTLIEQEDSLLVHGDQEKFKRKSTDSLLIEELKYY